jgi:hypothetical protein
MKHEGQIAFRREQPEPVMNGNLFTRSLTIRTIASIRHTRVEDIAAEMFPNDRALAQLVTRAASAPATTFTTGWAAELVHKIVADTLTAMGAASGAAEVMQQCLTLEWNGAGIISAPAFVASANNASFVQEGAPIPVRQLNNTPVQLTPTKLASIAALTREMAEGSNAEALISDALVRSMGLGLDAVFFGSGAATGAQPAGIRNGIVTSTPSASTDPFGAFFEDMDTLINAVSQVGGKGPFIIVASAGRIVSANTRFTDRMHSITDQGAAPIFTTIASAAVGNDMIALAPQAIVAAISAEPDVEATSAATLVMDTAPGAAGTTGSGEKGMFQTDSIAAKVRWPVNWALRDPRAVAWLTPVWK